MKWLQDLSINLKIALSFTLLFLILAGFGGWTFQFSNTVQEHSILIIEKNLPFAQLAEKMSRDIIQIQQWLTDISATRAQDGLDDGFEEAESSYREFITGLDSFSQMYRENKDTAGLKSIEQLRSKVTAYYGVGKQMAQAYIDHGPEGGNKLMENFDNAAEELYHDLSPFVEQQTGELSTVLSELLTEAGTLKNGVIMICLTATLFVLLIGWLLARSIVPPLAKTVAMVETMTAGQLDQRLDYERTDEIGILAKSLDVMADNLAQKADLAGQIADGNLNVEVQLASEKDQLGLALQTMVINLNDILSQIQVAGEQIASGSGQVAESSQALSQGAAESASSLEEISASLNQLSSQTGTNAENANTANQLAGEARHSAQQGSLKMQEMIAAMAAINQAGQSISRIIKVIDEIAFQTNLLALNAAVEAARAGQHGKGFAVVAEEVRNLAARSAKAAQETSELIEGSVQKTANGTHIADQTAAALESIVNGIGKVTDLVAEIAAASSEQAQGVAQINQGISQIDQVTQQNTASAEESAAASEELSGQATQLREMLMRFTLKHGSSPHFNVRAVPPKKIAATKVATRQEGWGESPPAPKKLANRQVIALDDDEFGKY